MEQDRAVQLLGVPQQAGEVVHIVPVHRAQVSKAHVLEHTAMEDGVFHRLLRPVGEAVQPPPRGGGPGDLPVYLFKLEVLGLQPLLGQVPGHAPHVLGDGHPVVVEDHHQLLPALARIGKALIGQPARHGPVPQHGENAVIFPVHRPGPGHPQGHRHRVGGVARDERVRPVLPGLGEAGQPPQLPQGVHPPPPLGEDFVGVALVAHIEHQPVRLQVEHPVDGHRGLHHPQAGGQMAPGFGNAVHNPLPELIAQHPGL